MNEEILYAGQTIRTQRFEGKNNFREIDDSLYQRVRASVFKEHDPILSPLLESASGTIVHGDVHCPHTEATQASSFEDFSKLLGDDSGWLVVTGDVTIENSLALAHKERVVVLGDLKTVGLSNRQGELHVEGKTTVTGGMMFDSNNGGFTKLNLAEPVGFVCTTSNVFDIDLQARYYLDPLFRCGFTGSPTTAHEERILGAFASASPPILVDLNQLADFFEPMSAEVAAEVRSGEYEDMLEYVLVRLKSDALVQFFDKS